MALLKLMENKKMDNKQFFLRAIQITQSQSSLSVPSRPGSIMRVKLKSNAITLQMGSEDFSKHNICLPSGKTLFITNYFFLPAQFFIIYNVVKQWRGTVFVQVNRSFGVSSCGIRCTTWHVYVRGCGETQMPAGSSAESVNADPTHLSGHIYSTI